MLCQEPAGRPRAHGTAPKELLVRFVCCASVFLLWNGICSSCSKTKALARALHCSLLVPECHVQQSVLAGLRCCSYCPQCHVEHMGSHCLQARSTRLP